MYDGNYEPVALQFSLFATNVRSDTHSEFLSAVMEPILQHVLCQNGFFVMAMDNETDLSCLRHYTAVPENPDVNGCDQSTTTNINGTITTAQTSTSIFNRSLLFEEDPDVTILRPAPILVEDRTAGNVNGTSWTLYYHVEQLSESLQEMAWVGIGLEEELVDDVETGNVTIPTASVMSSSTTVITSVDETKNGIQIHFDSDEVFSETNQQMLLQQPNSNMMYEAVSNVLKLALEVNIMEGTVDATLQQELPGAKFSCPGEELVTFASESKENVSTSSSSLLQNFTVPPMTEPFLEMPPNMSMVAMSMYTSNTLRSCGAVMLVSTLLLFWSLTYTAQRQKSRQQQEEQAQEVIPHHVSFVPDSTNAKKKKSKKRQSPASMTSIVILAALLPLVKCYTMPPNFVIILTDDLDWTLGGACLEPENTLRRKARPLPIGLYKHPFVAHLVPNS